MPKESYSASVRPQADPRIDRYHHLSDRAHMLSRALLVASSGSHGPHKKAPVPLVSNDFQKMRLKVRSYCCRSKLK